MRPRFISSVSVIAMLSIAFTTFDVPSAAWSDEKDRQADAKQADPDQEPVEAKEDRYRVPDGDVAELSRFIDSLRSFRPTTVDEILDYRKRVSGALEEAAKKLLEKADDPQSPAARKAKYVLLELGLRGILQADPERQAEYLREVEEYLSAAEKLTQEDLNLAFTMASLLERQGATELAARAYQTFGEKFSAQGDERLASYGQKMLGAARRATLLGSEMKITGNTLAGKDFDWSQYRGKVVLVDFWATWCGPCIAELPNVKKNYERYHDRGFEVVGISLDEDRQRLERFIKERELPWVTLFEDGAGWEHPMASYYGVMAIPTVILVDQDGKVVSMNARGDELGQQLEHLFGSTNAD